MDISIILLNYKQKGLVKQCIKGILASQPQISYELLVVDNNSQDGCLEMVDQMLTPTVLVDGPQAPLPLDQQRPLPPFKTIQLESNTGFSFAHNRAIERATGKYMLVMNPDIAVVPGALEHMVAYMETHPDVGIVGPRLINPDGSVQQSCRRFPSWRIPFYRRSLLGSLPAAKIELAEYLMADWDHNQTRSVEWIFGACLLIRRSVMDKIGMFDERFFLYFEDLDLCRRCWESGNQVIYLTEVEMVHYHQRLSAERSGMLGILKPAGRMHLMSGVKYYAKYLGTKTPSVSGQLD